jgi:hypothetical protein
VYSAFHFFNAHQFSLWKSRVTAQSGCMGKKPKQKLLFYAKTLDYLFDSQAFVDFKSKNIF